MYAMFTPVLWMVWLAASVSPSGSVCRPAAAGACLIELHGDGVPRAGAACTGDAWAGHLTFALPGRFADADVNGWHEAVLELDLDPKRGCECAVFRVRYEGDPFGWTVNVGDSPTNDGYGGDAWSTKFDAEILVAGRDLEAFGADRGNSPAETRIFGMNRLPLRDRVLELEICDQSLRVVIDELTGYINTHVSQELLAIRAAPAGKKDAPDARIYAAFNRVIHRRAGRPAHDRFGTGVRSVEISLTP
jgi:hypothetical protein